MTHHPPSALLLAFLFLRVVPGCLQAERVNGSISGCGIKKVPFAEWQANIWVLAGGFTHMDMTYTWS